MKKIFCTLILSSLVVILSCSFVEKENQVKEELPPGYVWVRFNIPSSISRSAPSYNAYDSSELSKTFSLYKKLSSDSSYSDAFMSSTFNTIANFNTNLIENSIYLQKATWDFKVTVKVQYQEKSFVALIGEVTNMTIDENNNTVSISLRERNITDNIEDIDDIWGDVIGGLNLTIKYTSDPTNVYGGLCTLVGSDFYYTDGYSKDTVISHSDKQIIINNTSLAPGNYFVHLIFKKDIDGVETVYDQRLEWVHVAPGLTTTNTVTFSGDNTPYLITYNAQKEDGTALNFSWVSEDSVPQTFNSSMIVTLPSSNTFNIPGYEFVKWQGQNVKELVSGSKTFGWSSNTWTDTNPIANQTVTAVFIPKTYNIYYYNGTEEITNQITGAAVQHVYDTSTSLPQNVEISGYTFQGWYSSTECSGNAVTQIEANQVPADETGGFKFYAKLALNAGFTVTLPSYSTEDIIDGAITYNSDSGNISFKVKDTYKDASITVFLDATWVDLGTMGEGNLYQFTMNDLSVGYHQLLVVAAKSDVTYSQIKEFQNT
jgi:hypothetical protein